MLGRLDEAFLEVCGVPDDKSTWIYDPMTWKEWKEALVETGFKIMSDEKVAFTDEKILSPVEALDCLKLCTCARILTQESEVVKIVSEELSIEEWRKEFTRLSNNPPIGEKLQTENGEPIRLDIELYPGKAPLMFTRTYVPKIVGVPLGWFAQPMSGGLGRFGWKVIILPKSRDEAIRRLGIDRDSVPVNEIRVIKMSESQLSLLGEISRW